jgi:amino acid adenylation domain-containing protein
MIAENLDVKQKIEEKYWIDKLRGARMQPLVPSWCKKTGSMRVHSFTVSDGQTTAALNRIAGNNPAARYAILLSALKILIFKYLQEEDIVVAAADNFRAPEAAENLAFFRTTVHRDTVIASLIKETASQLSANRSKNSSDLSYLKDKIKMTGNDEYQVLQHIGFFTSDSNIPAWAEDLSIWLQINCTSNIEVQVNHTLTGECDGWIASFARHYGAILEQVTANPKQTVASISMLSGEEREELIYGLNNSGFSYREDGNVSLLFEKQALLTPLAGAIVFKDEKYTYQSLNEKVNQLASYLVAVHAIDNSKIAAVKLNRSAWSAVAMLAIIKTGACYLPLDAGLPEARLNYILQNASPAVVLTETALLENNASLANTPFVDVTTLALDGYSKENPSPVFPLDSPAFLIYTSGSTGLPKAVVQTHRTLYNLVLWDNAGPGFTNGSSILQYSSFAFDSSLHDIYYALSSGGAAHIVPEEMRLDFLEIARYVVDNGIVIFSLPFSVLASFFNSVDAELLSGHKIGHIISTGEQLLVGAGLEKFLKDNPGIILHNFYGPSETHVVTAWAVSAGQHIPARAPVGKPIFNSQIFILDKNLELVPRGMTGEVYIGGHNLAIGYLNDSGLTERKFLNNPFIQNAKMYKSGDLGRWLPDGDLEYRYPLILTWLSILPRNILAG